MTPPVPASPPAGRTPLVPRLRRWTEVVLKGAVTLLMTALAVVVVLGVSFRKAGAALVWYDEVASILLAWLTFYGAALAALRRAHIGVPTLLQSVGPRARTALVLVGEAVVLSFFVTLAWAGWRVVQVVGGQPLVSLPSVPYRLAYSAVPIGVVLFVVAELLSLPEALRGPPGEPPAGEGHGAGGGDQPEGRPPRGEGR